MRRPSPQNRVGLTLIQVVAGILFCLVCLLLLAPMMLSWREKSRHAACQSNLQLLGEAMNLYHVHWRCLPPGALNPAPLKPWTTIGDNERQARSAFVSLLPELEERMKQKSPTGYAQNFGPLEPPNVTVSSRTVRRLICPTNTEAGTITLDKPALTLGRLDYALNYGALSFHQQNDWINHPRHGAFGLNVVQRLEANERGAGQVILIGDASSGMPADWSALNQKLPMGRLDQFWGQGFVNVREQADLATAKHLMGSSFASSAISKFKAGEPVEYQPNPMVTGELYASWIANRRSAGQSANEAMPSNSSTSDILLSPACVVYDQGVMTASSLPPFRSYHLKTSNFLMGDGSVRSLVGRIDPEIFQDMTIWSDQQQKR